MTRQLLAKIEEDGATLANNSALRILIALIRRFQFAVAELDHAAPEPPEGNSAYRLRVCGCRAEIGQEELARELGISSNTVGRAIKTLKELDYIYNWGHGWYEIDADFAWCGPENIRQAYTMTQAMHPKHPNRLVVSLS
ncbi:winged helix-turn-helix domain-containing protein [Agaricicola taiwanensis]